MRVMIQFKNPKTGELKKVKLGFSWTLFLFSGLFGLPLFLRKLNVWGALFLVLWVINLIAGPLGINLPAIQGILLLVFLCLQIWFGIKGNEITAKNYLEKDWVFAEPDSEFTKLSKQQWGITV